MTDRKVSLGGWQTSAVGLGCFGMSSAYGAADWDESVATMVNFGKGDAAGRSARQGMGGASAHPGSDVNGFRGRSEVPGVQCHEWLKRLIASSA